MLLPIAAALIGLDFAMRGFLLKSSAGSDPDSLEADTVSPKCR
jgi:hypothetical protein